MKGFRIDKAENGFIMRELHPNPKQQKNRKYAVGRKSKEIIKVIKKWLKNM